MIKIAIVGATGLVGKKIIEVLDEQNILKIAEIKLFVSGKNEINSVNICGRIYGVEVLKDFKFDEKFDIVFFSAGDDVSKIYVKKFADSGSFVIDNSNAYRRDLSVPLVCPEINIDLINEKTKIIANPNCTTIELAVVINKLLKMSSIDKIIISTYQSVSGAGSEFLEKFWSEKNNQNNTKKISKKTQINDNLIVKIGEILENGFSLEEDKIMFELNKILGTKIKICATAVRVPMPFCHGESVFVKFKSKVNFNEIMNCVQSDHIVFHNPKELVYPLEVVDTDATHMMRVRKFSDTEIAFFILADNLRRGAAYNAVMIAKYIIENIL